MRSRTVPAFGTDLYRAGQADASRARRSPAQDASEAYLRGRDVPAFGADLYRPGPAEPLLVRRDAVLPRDLRTIWSALTTGWMTVAALLLAGILVAVAYIWVTPPTYSATAEILIDPRKHNIIDKEIVQSGLGTSSLGPDTFLLDSQVEVMLSQSVLRGLIDREGLASDPEFVGTPPSSLKSGVSDFAKLLLRGPQAGQIEPTSDYERALAALLKRLDIKRRGNTYVFAVSMRSHSAVKAAEIANALVTDYIAEVNRSSRERVEEASRLLNRRLDELRRSVSESREKVEAFRKANGLIAAERLPVIEQQLRDLNLQLARVSATANFARSRWQEVGKLQSVSPDSALASGLIESQSLTALRERAAALTVEEGSLAKQLMDRHPSVSALRESRAALDRSIRAEVRRIIARSKYEFEVAQGEEASLRTRITALEAATAQTNRANVKLQELQREAEANVAIYEQFLSRSKSAREQINIPFETVGLISKAFPPTRPAWPVEPLILAFGAVVGLLLGMVAAVIRQMRADDLAADWTPRPALMRPLTR